MSRASANYEVARSTGVCASTGRALAPGEACIAILCEREADDGFDRRDVSIEAWDSGWRPPNLFSYWKTTVPNPSEKRRLFVDDELLLNLFERLADDDRPQRVAFRFVLALVLMRKRLLRYVGRTDEGGRPRWLLVPRGAAGSPPIEVADPGLSEEDARTVSDQLGEILQGDLE